MPEWALYILLFVTGVVAGTLNVIAGGGSFLTLPALIFLGLPAGVANGTNRVGILIQNVGAVWSFRREGVLDSWRQAWVGLPAAAGAVLGVWAALQVGDDTFRKVLAFLMVAISLFTLWDPLRSTAPRASAAHPGLWLGLGFFVAGVYGGFVQAGVGFLILTVTTLAGLDLVRGNGIKVLCILIFTALALALFAWQGKVEWPVGLVLGAGTLIGGQIGVKLTVLKGHRWLRGVVTATIVVFAVRLWTS
jgi:uncharacterized membrane protein YfcA